MLSVTNVGHSYGQAPVLEAVSFYVGAGESLALMGPSGSGKTTLLNCVTGIVVPQHGSVCVGGTELSGLSASRRSKFRLGQIGLVFQSHELIPELSTCENVALPLTLAGVAKVKAVARAIELLGSLGLRGLENRMPEELSGGQQQRAGIARALINEPALVVADEPTGMLDRGNTATVMNLLLEATSARGCSLVMATHDPIVAKQADRILTLDDLSLKAAS